LCGPGHVRLREDADETIAFHDRQPSHLLLGHALERGVERLVTSATCTLLGSRSLASTLITRSRSVTMPTSFPPSTTGSEPTFSDDIVRAASTTVASVGIDVGDEVIASRTFALPPMPASLP
jgi:hypothetical protein